MFDDVTGPDLARRFGGVGRLYGHSALERFRAAHACVIGIGGVGSWAAEALARNSIGRITLIDLDNVCESNVNRQVHAIDGEFGKAKVTAMAQRIRAINPVCIVEEVEDFVTADNLAELLGRGYDGVIDAIDNVRVKAAIIDHACRRKLPLVTVGGAGGQVDPTRIRVADLSRTVQDPLLAKVRKRLRQEYGFSKDLRRKFGIEAVYSDEPLNYPEAACDAGSGPAGLNCAGFGSSVCVTAVFGLVAASRVLAHLQATPAVAPAPAAVAETADL